MLQYTKLTKGEAVFMEKADKWDRRFMELTETVAGWSS